MRQKSIFRTASLGLLGLFLCLTSAVAAEVQLKSDFFSVNVAENGQVTSAVELKSGKDWLAPGSQPFAALVMKKGTGPVRPQKIEWVSDAHSQLRVTFANGASALLNYESKTDYFTLEAASVTVPDGDFYRLEFGCVTLKPDYAAPDAFGFSTLILTIPTNVAEFPGKASRLGAKCYSEIGVQGAKAAFVGVPEKEMRRVMKSVTEWILAESASNPEYRKMAPPVSRNGGGFAMDGRKNYGSYIITSTPIKAEEVAAWAEHLKQFGVDQIDFHQGTAFRQGDFHFNETAYPNGVSDFRRMTDELKKHGMIAGFHTYSEFAVGNSKYLTPVPHADLDVIRSFTLAEDLTETAKEVPVSESTQDVSLICGFTIKNSLYLKIDSEIIGFHELAENGKGFTKCDRGAFGTKVASHAKGAKVDHLTRFFSSYFAPNPKTPLFLEIARNTAKTYDEGGFRMIYLDALDGTGALLDDRELTWYYDALFVREILTHITSEPPLLEYSTMHPSLWAARSRMGAWDSPAKAYIEFFDRHFASNERSALKCYLPAQIGWFAVCPSKSKDEGRNFQIQTLYREQLDYLGAKTLAWNSGFSYLDVSLGLLTPAALENGKLLNAYDSLRRANYFSPEICEKVREPGKHFHLQKIGEQWLLRPAQYAEFETKSVAESGTQTPSFRVSNPYAAQKPYLRIENLYADAPYDSPEAQELIPFDENQKVEPVTCQTFEPTLNLSKAPGMGMWVYGDGKGQLLNVRVESPYFMLSGVNDHHIKLDHQGWKYVEFAEATNGRFPETRWPAGSNGLYTEFRTRVHYQSICDVFVMVAGPTEGLRFRTLKALPILETQLKDPTLTLAGQKVTLRGSIPSGCYAEILPESDEILVKDPVGNVLGKLEPDAPIPAVPAGESDFQPSFDSAAPRTRWTFGLYE